MTVPLFTHTPQDAVFDVIKEAAKIDKELVGFIADAAATGTEGAHNAAL